MSTYDGRSPAIRTYAGPNVGPRDHAYPAGDDLSVPKYRGRALIRVVALTAGVLDDFDRTTGDDPGCTSRDHYRYQRVSPDVTYSTSSTGASPLSVDGGQMVLRLPARASIASMRSRLVLPFSRLDRAVIEFDLWSNTPDFVPPDGVADGSGINLEATFGIDIGGATLVIGEVVQVYAYPPSSTTLFRQFVDVDNGDIWLDDDIQLSHALSHGSLRNGAHVTMATSRVTSGAVRLDVTIAALDALPELTNVTSGAPTTDPAARSVSYSRIVDWEEVAPADTVEIVLRGTCAHSGGGAGGYRDDMSRVTASPALGGDWVTDYAIACTVSDDGDKLAFHAATVGLSQHHIPGPGRWSIGQHFVLTARVRLSWNTDRSRLGLTLNIGSSGGVGMYVGTYGHSLPNLEIGVYGTIDGDQGYNVGGGSLGSPNGLWWLLKWEYSPGDVSRLKIWPEDSPDGEPDWFVSYAAGTDDFSGDTDALVMQLFSGNPVEDLFDVDVDWVEIDGPYDASDVSWRLDNLNVTTNDATSVSVPKC